MSSQIKRKVGTYRSEWSTEFPILITPKGKGAEITKQDVHEVRDPTHNKLGLQVYPSPHVGVA